MQKFQKNYSIGLSLVAINPAQYIQIEHGLFLPHVNILSAFSSFYLPLTGEGQNIMTSVNLTMCF